MMRSAPSARLLSLLLAVALLTSACAGLPLSVPVSQSATTPTAPVPSPPMTLPETPPAIVAFRPLPGQEVSPEAALIEVTFDRPMERRSVETALRVTPVISGEISWRDDRTLQFRPQTLTPETRYRVLLDTTALSAQGVALGQPLAFAFATLGPLQVTNLSPAPDTEDLRGDAPLLITFNRAIVPVHCTGNAAGFAADCPALPLTMAPKVTGNATWVNTSVYRFDPLPGWDAGTTYEVTLAAGVTSVDGAMLAENVVWRFTTAVPRILAVFPPPASFDQPLESAIRVAFNTPMDPVATSSAFTLVSAAGEPVPGTLTWSDGGAQLVFTPTQPLALETRYVALVTQQAKSRTGAFLEAEQRWDFTTVPYPASVAMLPTDGARNVELYESVRITFRGAISEATILPQLVITPAVAAADRYTWWDGQVFHLSWQKAPRTRYCVQLRPGVLDRYGHATTTGRLSCFTTGDEPPFFAPATTLDTLVLDATLQPTLYFLVRNVPRADFQLQTLSERGFISDADTGSVQRSWSETYRNDPNVVAVTPVALTARNALLAPGFYRLSWQVASNSVWRTGLPFAVVDRHLTLKLTADEALVWVTDLRTGDPLAGVEVRLLDESATLLGAGVTDKEGVARIRISPLDELWSRLMAIVGRPGAPGFGVALSSWDYGASPWNFELPVQYGDFNPYQLYLYSDRPIYRPGQTVQVRGILREDRDVRYTLPDIERTVALTLRDADWRVVLTTTAQLSDLGSFAAALPLSAQAPLGSYTVQVTLPGASLGPYGPWTWELPLTVAAYRKPEFEVTVTPERDDVLRGEMVRALVEARYLFGGPVANARVHWEVRAEPASFTPAVAGWWAWSTPPESYAPLPVASGTAATDAEGRLLLEWLATLPPTQPQQEPVAYRWVIEATVVDASQFPVSGRTACTVHAARFYLGLQPRTWMLAPGVPSTVDLLALDWDGVGMPEQAVKATLARRIWASVPTLRPFAEPTWIFTDTVIATFNVTTDAAGAAEIVVTPPRGGAYVLIAEALDAERHPVRTELQLWVSGPEGRAWQLPEGRVTPVTDARRYRPGDTATIFLPTPFQGPFQVLMTVERGGILQVQRLVFEEPNPILTLPILESYAPNVFVSFIVLKGGAGAVPPDVRMGWVELTVEPVAQTLKVELLPQQPPPYTPGTTVPLTVRTMDANGRAVDAEVGLTVVDQAVLMLTEPNAPSILEGFYGRRSLRVRTGNSLLLLYSRLAASLTEVAANAQRLVAELLAGGLGGGGNGAPSPLEVRQDFPDTALWMAQLRTGLTGETQINVPLPDSLTTWVVDARAVTVDTRVGEAQALWPVRKSLFVRPVTPRFFVAGDRLEVAAIVHNTTDQPLIVTASLAATGAVALESAAEQQLSLPAQGQQRVAWQVAATQAGDSALLTFSVTGGGYSDSARPTLGQPPDGALPVYRYTSPDTFGVAGVLETAGSRVEAVVIPENAGPATRLQLQLEPSLAASMVSGLTALELPRYASTESLVSRFLLNVLNYRALQAVGMDAPELERRLQQLVPEALEQLYGRQRQDGAWGWYEDGPADLQLSAYVALGLWEAQQAGFTVRTPALETTLAYLEQVLLKESLQVPRQWTSSHALALYVLAMTNRVRPGGVGEALYTAREQLGITGQAYLVLALGQLEGKTPRVTALLDGLRGAATRSATGAHWEEDDARYWVTDVRATAVTLTALLRLTPEDPLISSAVRWLLVARRGDRWATTQETAWALLALTDYWGISEDARAAYEWQVAFNGALLGSGRVTPTALQQRERWTLDITAGDSLGLLPGRVNALEIARGEGPGHLGYTAQLTLDVPVAALTAESRGITLQRAYCAVTDPARLALMSSPCIPITLLHPGDLVDVRLTVIVPKTRYFLTVEDFYPAGLEPINPGLLTEASYQPAPGYLVGPGNDARWWQPFDHVELRDERAVFFSRALPAGTYHVGYRLRAVMAGEFRVLPAVAAEQYFPEVWGRSAGTVLIIRP